MIKEGQIYRHFKGDLMRVVCVCKHTETEEELVVYEHNNELWARPKSMFLSKVDKSKYPSCKQEYRFELVK